MKRLLRDISTVATMGLPSGLTSVARLSIRNLILEYIREALGDTIRSRVLFWLIDNENRPASYKTIGEESRSNPHTVRYTIENLIKAGIVEQRLDGLPPYSYRLARRATSRRAAEEKPDHTFACCACSAPLGIAASPQPRALCSDCKPAAADASTLASP